MPGNEITGAAALVTGASRGFGRGIATALAKAGANLAPDRAVGKRTWEEFLADLAATESDGQKEPRCSPSSSAP